VSDLRPKIILQAHATRSAVALAVLLHGRDRSARDVRNPFGALVIGLVIGVVILVAVYITTKIGALPPKH
jgi:hypothetical protein